MKTYINITLAAILICLAGITNNTLCQSLYKIKETNDIDMKLLGTSTLHKWEMDARKVDGEAQFGFKGGDGKVLTSVNGLTFSLEVKDLKSDSKGLDKNANKALKSDEYKDIHYKLTSAVVSPEKDGKFLMKTEGKLTIAGVTKKISMNVRCVVNADATISCSGSFHLNMTDYNVKPPTFMLGAMKTGDAITLEFAVIYKKENGA